MRLFRIAFVSSLMMLCFCVQTSAQQTPQDFPEKKYLSLNPATDTPRLEGELRNALEGEDYKSAIQAYLSLGVCKTMVSVDSLPEVIAMGERMITRFKPSVAKSMMHYVLAYLYGSYYGHSYHELNKREVAEGDTSSNIRTWGYDQFARKIMSHYQSALKDKKTLAATPVSSWSEMLNVGIATNRQYASLLDLISYQIIENLSHLYNQGYWKDNNSPEKFREDQIAIFLSPDEEFLAEEFLSDAMGYIPNIILSIYQDLMRQYADDRGSEPYIMANLNRADYARRLCRNSNSTLVKELYHRIVYATGKNNKESANSIDATLRMIFWYQNEIALMNNTSDRTKKIQYVKIALNYCYAVIRRFPNDTRIDAIKALRDELLRPEFTCHNIDVTYPSDIIKVRVTHKNVNSIKMELYRLDISAYELSKMSESQVDSLCTKKILDKQYRLTTLDESLINRTTTYLLPGQSSGIYILKTIVNDKVEKPIYNELYVTRLYALSHQIYSVAGKVTEIMVTDRKSGEPIQNAEARVYQGNSEIVGSKSDQMGIIKIADKNVPYANFVVYTDDDNGLFLQRLYYDYEWMGDQKVLSVNVFSDRSLYRPGQTVYFGGLVCEVSNDNSVDRVVPQHKTKVSLRKAHSKEELNAIEVVTDEFGSFSGEFALPADLALGDYMLYVEGKYICYFEVIEYKRPTFKIEVDKYADQTQFGKPLTLSGRVESYAGAGLANSKVECVISRTKRYYSRQSFEHVENISTVTDTKGAFKITITPQISDTKDKNPAYIYSYQIKATDSNGETQTASVSMIVGHIPALMELSMLNLDTSDDFAGSIESGENIKMSIRTFNQSKKPIDASGHCTVYLSSDSYKTVLYEMQIDSSNKTHVLDISKLPSGMYNAHVSMKTSAGDTISEIKRFRVWSYQDKRLPQPLAFWTPKSRVKVAPGESTPIYIGSRIQNAYVFYEVFVDGKSVNRSRFMLNDGVCENVKVFDFKYNPKWKTSALLQFTVVKNGIVNSKSIVVERAKPDMNLNIKAVSFRDKIAPGSTEKWTFTVTDALGKGVDSRILATMFDNKLSSIAKHNWYFNPYRLLTTVRYPGWSQSNVHSYLSGPTLDSPQITIPASVYDELYVPNIYDLARSSSLFGASRTGETVVVGYGTAERKSKSDNVLIADVVGLSASEPKYIRGVNSNQKAYPKLDVDGEAEEVPIMMANDGASEIGVVSMDYRKDFNETAFFYPKLQTDSKGITTFEFEVPQSNTEWVLKMLAYTKDLKNGSFEKIVVSSKDIMVRPNMPRFLRGGDKANISFSVANLTGVEAAGEAYFELFDMRSDTTILKQNCKFKIQPGVSQSFDFNFVAPADMEQLGVRVSAATQKHTDGEQHMIPLLPARTLITEITSLNTIDSSRTVEVTSMNNRSQTKQDFAVTLEVMANPMWSVIEALPTISESGSKCITNLGASLYANAMAYNIANTYTDIGSALSGMAKNGESSLTKNAELKYSSIDESPWRMLALKDSERIGALTRLLDKNRAKNLIAEDLKQIEKLRNDDGGWGWYKGFMSSEFITINILKELAQVNAMGLYSGDKQKLVSDQKPAIDFLDKSFGHDHKISYMTLLYLNVRSDYGVSAPFVNLLVESVAANWQQMSVYERALAAVALKSYGKTEQAEQIVNSLRGMATVTQDGMWWQNNRGSHPFFSNISVLCHVAVIDAFRKVDPKPDELQKMTAWLISQKQVQKWESVPSTVNAISAIMSSQPSPKKQGVTKVEWGDMTFDLDTRTPLASYVKKSVVSDLIAPELKDVKIVKQSNMPMWGAVYHQYYEDFSNVIASSNGLSVRKELLIERDENGEKRYHSADKTAVKVGDKMIVKLVITCDRDMEYVVMKDSRAACMECVEQQPQVVFRDGVYYVAENRDASTSFFINFLPKGTFVLTYEVWIDRTGTYSVGNATVQSMYAPQFNATSAGGSIVVGN